MPNTNQTVMLDVQTSRDRDREYCSRAVSNRLVESRVRHESFYIRGDCRSFPEWSVALDNPAMEVRATTRASLDAPWPEWPWRRCAMKRTTTRTWTMKMTIPLRPAEFRDNRPWSHGTTSHDRHIESRHHHHHHPNSSSCDLPTGRRSGVDTDRATRP